TPFRSETVQLNRIVSAMPSRAPGKFGRRSSRVTADTLVLRAATVKALALACLILQASLLTAAPSAGSPQLPKSCGFGHTDVKRVPIMYGLLAMDADLQWRIDHLEVWPGGCIVGDEKEKLVCKTCRYYYEPLFGYWSKDTSDPKLLQ